MSAPDYANCQSKDSSCVKGDVHTCRKVSLGFSIALNLPYVCQKAHRQDTSSMSIDFKGSHFPKDVILYAVFFYIRYAV